MCFHISATGSEMGDSGVKGGISFVLCHHRICYEAMAMRNTSKKMRKTGHLYNYEPNH